MCCCHLCSGGHFLCSAGHHTQSVEGEHTQLPGAHSRLYEHTHAHRQRGTKTHLFQRINKCASTQVHSYKRMLTHPLFFTLYLTPARRQLLKIHQQDHITKNTLKVSKLIQSNNSCIGLLFVDPDLEKITISILFLTANRHKRSLI